MKSGALAAVVVLGLAGCGRPEGDSGELRRSGGKVRVEPRFNLCPEFDFWMVVPNELEPGGVAELIVGASDPEGGGLVYQWRAASGSFSDRDLPATAYVCDDPGFETLSVTAEDEDGCAAKRDLDVACLE